MVDQPSRGTPPGSFPLHASLEIDARLNLVVAEGLHQALIGLTGELADSNVFTASDGETIAPCYAPMLETCYAVITPLLSELSPHATLAHDVITRLGKGEQIANPMLSMQLGGFMGVLSDLLERISRSITLPVSQWRFEMAAEEIPRESWPKIWRTGVRLGCLWHLLEDLAELRQACSQILGNGGVVETRRWAGAMLWRLGAGQSLLAYRDAVLGNAEAREGKVAAQAEAAFDQFVMAALQQAEQAVSVADLCRDAQYLDAKDVFLLGVHSQTCRYGGVFLSHRGPDAKRALMQWLGERRASVYLDIWATPRGDTNRRFLWRNLCASRDVIAFVTETYVQSDYCMKEVEGWGLVNRSRGLSAEQTPGAFNIIGSAATARSTDVAANELGHWSRTRATPFPTLEAALAASEGAITAAQPLGVRVMDSEQEAEASDAWNQMILASGMLTTRSGAPMADAQLIRLLHEPINGLFAFLGTVTGWQEKEAEAAGFPPAYLRMLHELHALLAAPRLERVADLLALLDQVNAKLGEGRASLSVTNRAFAEAFAATHVLSAMVETVRWQAKGLASASQQISTRALMALTKFGAIIDAARPVARDWIKALVAAELHAVTVQELALGLRLALLPIDHEAVVVDVTLDETTPALSGLDFDQMAAAHLNARTVRVVCSAHPHLWQRVITIAALSSFTSRNFHFVDIGRGGALSASVGRVRMEDFPHVTVLSRDDLPSPMVVRF